MEYAKTFVFQEITIDNAILYLWFKMAEETNTHAGIIPDRILTPEEHWGALMYD